MITPIQFERWKDFSLRMARTCFKHRRVPSAKEITENVEHFFDCLDPEDLLSIVDWDHSDAYPEGSSRYQRTMRAACWHCSKTGHGKRLPDCQYHCEDGQIFDYAHAQYVTDMCSGHAESWNPYYWEDLSGREYEKRDEQFCGPVLCCIRAGLDLAVAPSAGVMGFTAGDIRRMYPEGVPEWVTGGDEKWDAQHFVGVIPGVGLIPGKTEPNGTFASLPDSAGVWL